MLEQIVNMPISHVRSREPVKVGPDTPLGEVVGALKAGRTGCALVVDNGELIGVFTEHDLLRRIDHRNRAWRDLPVRAVMTEKPRVIRSDESIAEALRRMDAGKHRHLPVVKGREPVAVVSVRELLDAIASKFPADFLNLPPDPDKEARGPWGG